jgi:hypothetical protein
MGDSRRKSKRFLPALNDSLEDRAVPSHMGLGFIPSGRVASLLGGFGLRGGFSGELNFGFRGGIGGVTEPGHGQASTSTLRQDARSMQQAFQTLDASFLSAAAALRLTATSTAGPTQAGLDAYNSAIASAISTLNASISTALGNLPNTGAALISTIQGYTATLQTELQSAGTGLANNSNAAVLSLKREGYSYIGSVQGQTISTILNDQPAGSITSATQQTYNQAVNTAYQAFNLSINNAKQASISAGTVLDSTAVQTAVSTLQTALTSAINGLGQLSSSSYDPTSAVTSQLSTLQSQLLAITAPTAGNYFSVRAFSRAVSSVVFSNLNTINQTVATAIQNYNNSLL